jgi:WS/DGAT/MGAT family acyltransferase
VRKLSFLDLVFFAVESEDSPKHVAGLMLCRKPSGAAPNYAKKLLDELRAHEGLVEPFNLVIDFFGLTGPHWKRCRDFSIDEHVFYHRPDRVIDWDEVLQRAARLHEPVMDRSRPLWEFHLIDRVRGARFAVYFKLHHAYADGMTMTAWLEQSLAKSPRDLRVRPIWELPSAAQSRDSAPTAPSRGWARSLAGQAWKQLDSLGGIARLAAQQSIERAGLTRDAVALLFNTPGDTPMTGSATPGRLLATAALPMADVRRVCERSRSTVNHVALTAIDAALHGYLAAHGSAVDHPVSIQMPVSLRSADDRAGGNRLGIVLVDLAQPTPDLLQRHREIGYKLRNVKHQVRGVSGSAFEQFTILVAGLSELIEMLHLTDRLPSNGHTVVSNVPGPRKPLYIKGSKVEGMYPISTLSPGLRMNITLFSYADTLHLGIVATEHMVGLQVLADGIVNEFKRLDAALARPADTEVSP